MRASAWPASAENYWMFVKTFELAQSSPTKRAMYIRCLSVVLIAFLVAKTAWFSRFGYAEHRVINDFDAFYIAAQRVWLGDIDQAYQFANWAPMLRNPVFMPWTYPPQFDLLVSPLAFLPVGTAYIV